MCVEVCVYSINIREMFCHYFHEKYNNCPKDIRYHDPKYNITLHDLVIRK